MDLREKLVGTVRHALMVAVAVLSYSTATPDAGAACVTSPPGAVAWWSFDGNAADLIGTNVASLSGSNSFGAGEVGQALFFGGPGGGALVAPSPSLNVGA